MNEIFPIGKTIGYIRRTVRMVAGKLSHPSIRSERKNENFIASFLTTTPHCASEFEWNVDQERDSSTTQRCCNGY